MLANAIATVDSSRSVLLKRIVIASNLSLLVYSCSGALHEADGRGCESISDLVVGDPFLAVDSSPHSAVDHVDPWIVPGY